MRLLTIALLLLSLGITGCFKEQVRYVPKEVKVVVTRPCIEALPDPVPYPLEQAGIESKDHYDKGVAALQEIEALRMEKDKLRAMLATCM